MHAHQARRNKTRSVLTPPPPFENFEGWPLDRMPPFARKKIPHQIFGGENMPTRPKPVSVLRNEKRSHRTKAELEHREKAENALL